MMVLLLAPPCNRTVIQDVITRLGGGMAHGIIAKEQGRENQGGSRSAIEDVVVLADRIVCRFSCSVCNAPAARCGCCLRFTFVQMTLDP